ncbi:CheR family methyltransferase [Limisalsivibrio acetivorans]|uniref:CheR family methyltransferase n=1 Tax=Limisalsivibrio acetivorans TaxID=1304888 RepID=UPI0003B6A299|nr:protein-glutamate O-methyltransferase CheR [Limisalsivibrio acetivorans]
MIQSGTIKIKEDEFVELKDIIYKNSAISFADSKKYLLENRLTKRLQELNFNSFKDYIYYLKYNVKKNEEMEILLNLVTINETYFLRERGQMDYMVKTVIPELQAKGKRSIKIWSAACSSGEEPYSLAILLNEAGLFNKLNIEIMASDINTEVLNTAKSGVYRTVSFRGVPPNITSKYFTKDGFTYKLDPSIKSKIKFFQANLLSPVVGSKVGKVDIIFCRNVLIYFDVDAKKKVIDMFHRTLGMPGHMFLGHSETLNKINDSFTMKNFGGGIVYMK